MPSSDGESLDDGLDAAKDVLPIEHTDDSKTTDFKLHEALDSSK